MPGEPHMHRDIIACDDRLDHLYSEVRYGRTELARREGGPPWSLRAARRQGAVCETWSNGAAEQGFVAGIPESVECAHRLQGRLPLRRCDSCGEHEIVGHAHTGLC